VALNTITLIHPIVYFQVNARLKTVEDERNLIQNKIDIEIQSRMDMEGM
jgi:hypothetical protein